jgi:hypothetical protein
LWVIKIKEMTKFNLEVQYKELEKDGGTVHFDFIKIWSLTEERAKALAQRMWHRKFSQTDLSLIKIQAI